MLDRRLTRLFDARDRRTVIVPLDHGLAQGPLAGLERVPALVAALARTGIDAVVLNPGIAVRCRDVLAEAPQLGLIVHLSVGSTLGVRQQARQVAGTVDGALALGADGVSVHLEMGGSDDVPQLAALARVAERCRGLGVALLAMMYTHATAARTDAIVHAARMADELGADFVKIPYPGSDRQLRVVVEAVHCPVVCAGGSVEVGTNVLDVARAVVRAGAAGVACGRHVLGHERPDLVARALARVIHDHDPSSRPGLGGPIAVTSNGGGL
jgi:DhnA family fructose-bisphosphate aldolase class Ia